MKIIVVFKWGRDPQDARVGPDGSVDWRSAPMAVTDDDPAVLEVARAIASGADEIVGVTLGGGDVSWAAARGASSTVVVTDADSAPDSAAAAAILAAGVRYIGEADLVLVGDSAWDRAVPVCLAGQLRWPALAEVKSAKVEDGRLRVTRRFGGGTQVVDVAKPAVLAVAGSRAEQDPPGMKEVLAARRKPLSRVTLGELGVEPDAMVRSRGTALPDTAPARVIEGADPASAAAQLVAALRADGVIAG